MSNDNWRTPPEVFKTLNYEFQFLADMACTKENKLCPVGFTEEHDSLSLDWIDAILHGHMPQNIAPNSYVFLNCPYSDPMPWVKKVIETQRNGLGVVMLLNNDTSVGWFSVAYEAVSEIRNIMADKKDNGKHSSGRLAFIDDSGKPVSGNNKAQFILVFNPFKIGARVTSYVTKSELYGGAI